jgi:hypothetical protein
MTHDEFINFNKSHNDPLQKHTAKAQKDNVAPQFFLPESERIYFKDFHFLEEPLIERQKKKEEQKRGKKTESNKIDMPVLSN